MNDYLWKIRCPESGYIVAECGCFYCYDEYELDAPDDFAYLDEDLEPEDEDIWDEFSYEEEEYYE